jgi:anti-sigma factor RsiW
MTQASHTFHRAHFWRVEAIDTRRRALADNILALDSTARSPHSRELWRGWRNAPPGIQARFDRLNRIVARYRIRGWL